MKGVPKKKTTKLILPKLDLDFSDTKPPTRLAVEAMLENLHNATK